jgi:hypothetical protein
MLLDKHVDSSSIFSGVGGVELENLEWNAAKHPLNANTFF